MTRTALNAAASVTPLVGAVSPSLHALTADELAGTTKAVRVVVPAPDQNAELPTRDGRTIRVPDPGGLAEVLNAQEPAARIDFDHQTERVSSTFRGSTASEGWLEDFHATDTGAIEATLNLSSWARRSIEEGRYRYLSPALLVHPKTREVLAMSSLALVNDPNIVLSINNAGADTDPDLAERERKIADREKAAEGLMMNAAERSVDTAVTGKRLAPAQKDFVLNSIRTHADGIEKGIEAFEKAFPATAEDAPSLHQLDRRVGPIGAMNAGAAAPSSFKGPLGRTVNEESLEMHSHVAAHAQARGISYRDAVMELGALQ